MLLGERPFFRLPERQTLVSPQQSRFRIILSFAFLCSVSASVGCATTPQERQKETEEEAVHDLAQEARDEKTIGQAIASALLGAYPLERSSPALSQYVSLVGQSLVLYSSRSGLDFYFSVLNSPEINAFATPGGYIFVTTGLLQLLENEDELAGVLAHEIAHVTEQHLHRELAPRKKVSATETLARILSRGRGDLGGGLSKMVTAGLKTLLENGLGMEKETQADQVGTEILSAAGYNPHAPLALLRRIDARMAHLLKSSPIKKSELDGSQELLAEQAKLTQVPKTHPPYPKRIALLNSYLSQNSLSEKTRRSPALTSRFQIALQALQGGKQ
jgi:predicted Zn-dependent protease